MTMIKFHRALQEAQTGPLGYLKALATRIHQVPLIPNKVDWISWPQQRG